MEVVFVLLLRLVGIVAFVEGRVPVKLVWRKAGLALVGDAGTAVVVGLFAFDVIAADVRNPFFSFSCLGPAIAVVGA